MHAWTAWRTRCSADERDREPARSDRGTSPASKRGPTDAVGSTCSSVCAPGDIDADDDDAFEVTGHDVRNPDRMTLQVLVEKMEYELERMKHQVRPARSREFLFEVFAGPQSQLTSQCIRKQRPARRYGLPECDLESEAGRQRLFADLLGHRPQHIWFAPVCRPWSAWSNLNGARSLEAFDDLQQKRQDMLGQLALGIVLMRYQVDHGRHLHWEQPSASLMLRLPGLREIRENTLAATFDMCRVGDLRDPATGQPMRKRTTVLTTLPALWETLDSRYCLGDHEHPNLEGSTTTLNQQILRTSFAEHYTRKFDRQCSDPRFLQRVQSKIPVADQRHRPRYAGPGY